MALTAKEIHIKSLEKRVARLQGAAMDAYEAGEFGLADDIEVRALQLHREKQELIKS